MTRHANCRHTKRFPFGEKNYFWKAEKAAKNSVNHKSSLAKLCRVL
jgi:hypothetical protein